MWLRVLVGLLVVFIITSLTSARQTIPASLAKHQAVLRDTSLAFHWTPGVWFMLFRVDCDHEDGMEAEIIDPSGRVLCPLRVGNPGAMMVANQCDCFEMRFGPREGSPGSSALHATSWTPLGGLYRMRVKGRAPCRVRISAGATFGRSPHWVTPDSMMIGSGEEHSWTAQWGAIHQGDSSRVRLRRVPETTLVVKLVDERTGEPCPYHDVMILPRRVRVTDEKGEVTFRGLAPGGYEARVFRPVGYLPKTVPVRVVANERNVATIRLTRRPGGRPVPPESLEILGKLRYGPCIVEDSLPADLAVPWEPDSGRAP